jgi:hypothetical protein
MPQQKYFMYHVLVKDCRGVVVTKQGDIPGNNVLHAVKCVENICKNTWNSSLYQVVLREMDFETGEIRPEPVFLWNKLSATVVDGELEPTEAKRVAADLDAVMPTKPLERLPAPKDMDETSHGVRFDPTEFGTVAKLPHQTFTTYAPKET